MSKQDSVVIVSGVRTPMGGLQGSLSTISAPDLGGIVIKEAVERAIRGRGPALAKGGREAAIAPKQETVGRVPAAADLTHDLVKGALSRAETVEPRLSLLPDEGFR